MAWGSPHFGGDSSSIKAELTALQSSCCAFAGLTKKGGLVGWGHPCLETGGESLSEGLSEGFVAIQSSSHAFCALHGDGTVRCWGSRDYGGLAPQGLGAVKALQATAGAFAALREDGTVSCWGSPQHGGDASEVQAEKKGKLNLLRERIIKLRCILYISIS